MKKVNKVWIGLTMIALPMIFWLTWVLYPFLAARAAEHGWLIVLGTIFAVITSIASFVSGVFLFADSA